MVSGESFQTTAAHSVVFCLGATEQMTHRQTLVAVSE